MSPYVRTVRTASGATAVQIVHSSRRGSRDIEYIGSAHDEAQLEVLEAAARQRLFAGQDELGLGLERTEPARRAAVPADHVVTYFKQIASALDKAHGYVDRNGMRRPIVHRDLKPQNLFLKRHLFQASRLAIGANMRGLLLRRSTSVPLPANRQSTNKHACDER